MEITDFKHTQALDVSAQNIYEGAEVEWDMSCPRRDIPDGTSQTGHPRWDVLFQMS